MRKKSPQSWAKEKRIIFFELVSVGLVTWIVFASPMWAYSATTRIVEWSDMTPTNFHQIVRSQFTSKSNLYNANVNESQIELALADQNNKVSEGFHVPSSLKVPVKFWLKVYTQYSTQNIVFFDSDHLELVYEVVDLKDLAESSRNQVVYEILSKRRIDKKLEAYKRAFQSLAKNPHPKHPTEEQKVILTQIKNVKFKARFKDLGKSLKYIRGQRDNVIQGLVAAEPYFPKMEEIFSEMNIPKELTRLSLVESSFNLKATSKVGASGVWQLMPAMGKKFLMMNEQYGIDERRSPLKSTLAAAKMLSWNYKYFGSWVLSVIAYNHGLKGLPRFKGNQNPFALSAKLFDTSLKKPLLGWASRSYYSEFLAMVYAEAYRDLFFGRLKSTTLPSIAFEQVTGKYSAVSYAMHKGVSFHEFSALNADIEDIHKTLPKGFWVALPSEKDEIQSFVSSSRTQKKSRHST